MFLSTLKSVSTEEDWANCQQEWGAMNYEQIDWITANVDENDIWIVELLCVVTVDIAQCGKCFGSGQEGRLGRTV
jgi:hypothetical protein